MIDTFIKKLLFVRQFMMNEGRIEILGVRKTLMPVDAIIQLQTEEKFYDIIKKQTMKEMESYAKMLNLPKEKLPVEQLLETYGIGNITITDFNFEKTRAIVTIMDSPIAVEHIKNKIKTTKPVCKYNQAVIAGTFSFIFGKEMSCEETKCITLGQKQCEFIVK